MKKVIILAIALIYVLSIVVVNFFGLEIQIFEGTVYTSDISVESITCPDLTGRGSDWVVKTLDLDTDYDPEKGACRPLIPNSSDTYYFYYIPFTPKADGSDYTPEDIDNPNRAVIRLRILPNEAEQKNIRFIFDEADKDKAVFDQTTRTITFLKEEMISVSISATDGSGVKTKAFFIQPKSALQTK